MEAKLEAYRTKKRREAMVEKAKNSIKGAFSWQEQSVPLMSPKLEDTDDLDSIASEESIDISPQRSSTITQVTYFLYFLLWATLYVIALQFEFGAVYFILSALIFIWKNTRSGPRKKGEVSAYSVFNPNCEAIQGSINMEQIEREMGWGTHS
ncbi:SAYSvFN domain-containing protein 1 [Fopius arisanus]|uniref:SAYSvFN domain-containing protein 1 n=1 Tax=Fopius arisanus TaxID=64838 RepID=A0A9R1TA33_9HYME|nr:PREDICTED: SAYSvFN domain-containing protein 1 [Fopius arisanus]